MANYDVMGNIVVVKFRREEKANKKKKFANKFLKEHKSVRTVLEKVGKFGGRLRKQKTKFILGEDTREVLYRENDCLFRFNVDSCYFSPRLSSERKDIASMIRKGENVLVLFAGIAVFGIVIAKLSKVGKVVSVEISRECNKYAKENVKRNKFGDKIDVISGDVRKVLGSKVKEKFERIVMPRPQLKDNFLDIVFGRIKKNGVIHYYGFYEESRVGELKEMIMDEARKAKKKIRILRIKKAGEVGVGKYRYRVDIKIK